jgi:flagellar hook-associated protein 2
MGMTTTGSVSSSTASTTTSTSSSSSTKGNASLGQSILSGLNAGAGIDTDGLITNLTTAQKAALEDPITAKQTTNTAQISTMSSIASDLATFSQSLATLISGGSLQVQPVSSNANVMTVASKPGVPMGDLTSTITVNALAQAQSLKSASFAANQTFNTGTLSFTVGTGSPVTINVTSSNNTVAGIAQAINAQNGGVTANVVTAADGSSTLVLKGKAGAAQAFTVSGSDTGTGGQSLSSLSYGGGATGGMTQTLAAQDASLTVDGVTVTRSSNSFDDVIPGVSMTLTGTGNVSLSSKVPTDAIGQAVNDFVSAYNSLMSEITTATAAAGNGTDAGPLRGNQSIRALKDQLSKLTTTNLNASGTVRTLAELGVKTGLDGTLSVDQPTLSKMLTNYPNDVAQMFQTSQSSSSAQVLITGKAGAAASGVYTVSGITPAVNGGNATGSINGVPMNAQSWNLTAGVGSGADGLALQILSGAPDTVTITINQGLGGALQTLLDTMNKTDSTGRPVGALATLTKSLTDQQTTLSDALTKADTQVQVYHDRLVTQFTTMNTLVSGYKATQSYLTQQIDLWTKSTS